MEGIPKHMMVLLGLSGVACIATAFFAGYGLTYFLLVIMDQKPNMALQILGGIGTTIGALASYFWNYKEYHPHDN